MNLRRLFGTAISAALLTALSGQIPDFKPSTPLLGAAFQNDNEAMARLLQSGANPNDGRFFGWTALQIAVVHANNKMAGNLLAHGADIRLTDGNGNTPLMWAVGSEVPNPEMVEELLKRGADAGVKNNFGESALTWAARRGNTEAIARLRAAGASDAAAVRQAAESAISLLQKSGPEFVKVSGCTSCHHQSLPQMLYGAARKRGFTVDETVSARQVKSVMAMFRPIREKLVDGSVNLPNPGISVGYSLVGLEAEGYAPDETTAAMTAAILRTQLPDGSFAVLPARPPLEASTFSATALSIRALQVYGGSAAPNIAMAREWLIRAKAATNEDMAMRLLGLAWSHAQKAEVDRAAAELRAAQRPDGGWAQLAGLESDAYATGQSLVALQIAGKAEESSPRAIAYLMRTQLADGSWLVRSRSNPLQPLKDSGFPHGRDQWISAAGTSWAALALTQSQPSVTTVATGDR
ncbi:MAG: ankyrin repeat domain-containing protein [Acidobacteria bacterium]|nr:ankyrin repeat domain-containing protein [Acidobacteriota bacterium]